MSFKSEEIYRHSTSVFNSIVPLKSHHVIRGGWNKCFLLSFIVFSGSVFLTAFISIAVGTCTLQTYTTTGGDKESLVIGQGGIFGDGSYYCAGTTMQSGQAGSWCYLKGQTPSSLCPNGYKAKNYWGECWDYSDASTTIFIYFMSCTPVSTAFVNAVNYTAYAGIFVCFVYSVIRMRRKGLNVLETKDWKAFLFNNDTEEDAKENTGDIEGVECVADVDNKKSEVDGNIKI